MRERYRTCLIEARDITLRSALRVASRTGASGSEAPDLHYGSPEFRSASDLVSRASSQGWPRAVLSSLAGGPDAARAVQSLLRLPVVTVVMTREEERAWKTNPFPPAARSIYEGHIAQAVLHLDPDDERYLTGGRSHDIRRQMRRAARSGVRAVSFATFDEWLQFGRPVLEGRPQGPEELVTSRGVVYE